MRIPYIDLNVNRPDRSTLAWYAGIGTMTAAGLVEWPLALVIVTGNVVAENARSRTVSGAAEGAAAAG
jgi:hypothetical protein